MANGTVTDPSVTDWLARHVLEWYQRIEEAELHAARRLLLNGLRASLAGARHPAIAAFAESVGPPVAGQGAAHNFWLGSATTSKGAALVNSAQWTLLLLDECHIPTGIHPSGAAFAASFGEAERLGRSGREVLEAAVLGIELQLAIMSVLQPTLRNRGFAPLSIPSAIGSAAASGLLGELTRKQLTNAFGIAMMQGVGLWEMAGTISSYYNLGTSTRSGVAAAEVAAKGVDAPPRAFEGEHGMLRAYGDMPVAHAESILQQLGHKWWIHELCFQRFSGDIVTQAPLECVLQIRESTPEGKRANLETLRFIVDPRVATTAETRHQMFGYPDTDLAANSDPKYCVAAAWMAGRFTEAEKMPAFRQSPELRSIRDRVVFEGEGDPTARRFQQARLEASFADGSRSTVAVGEFKGYWANPIEDAEIADLFREAATNRLSNQHAEEIIEAVWEVDRLAKISQLVSLLKSDSSERAGAP